MILCWATFLAILGRVWPAGHGLGSSARPSKMAPCSKWLALRAGLSGTSCVPNGAVIQIVVSGLQRVLLILFLQWPTVATQRDPSLLTVLKALLFLLAGLQCAQ